MDVDPRQYENIVVNDNDINNIVLSYLVHNCYKETVESFITCTGMKQPANHIEDMEKRKRIFHFALDGNALKAIELTEQLAPDLLEKNEDLHFDLLSLHFVELVCSRKCTEALEFAQTKLTPFGKVQKYVEKLEDFMALLAYDEPEKSPMFHLLSLEYRQHVADNLNRSILGWTPAVLSKRFFKRLDQQIFRALLPLVLLVWLNDYGFGIKSGYGLRAVVNAYISFKVGVEGSLVYLGIDIFSNG